MSNGPGSSEDEAESSSGILTVGVRLIPDGGPPSAGVDGVLSVHCNLPDTVGGDFEGVTVTVDGLSFTPAANAAPNAHSVTLFHLLREPPNHPDGAPGRENAWASRPERSTQCSRED